MSNKLTTSQTSLIGVAIANFLAPCIFSNPVKAQTVNSRSSIFSSIVGTQIEDRKNPLSGIIYTESNIPTENGNSILGFRRDNNGNLEPLTDSPFLTGGSGKVDPFYSIGSIDADQQIITNPEKTKLFAVNSGSNSIAVFNILPNGKLTPVEGSPFPSGGVYPVSQVLVGDFLYVANRNLEFDEILQDASNSKPNYTTFKVTPQGKLKQISTIEVPAFSGPEAMVVSPNKKFLFATEQYGQVMRVFRRNKNGSLSEIQNSPFSGFSNTISLPNVISFGPVGVIAHPKSPLLYVGYPFSDKILVYSYNEESGNLTLANVVSIPGHAACWFYINKALNRLYTAETFSNSLTVYDISDPTNPVVSQHVSLNGNSYPTPDGAALPPNLGFTSVGPLNISLDPTESFLTVITQRLLPYAPSDEGNNIHVLKVNPKDGSLSEVSSSPLSIKPVNDSAPQGLLSF